MSANSEHPERRETDRTDWLFHRLNTLEEKQDAQHARLRDAIQSGINNVSAEIHAAIEPMVRRIDDHSARLLVIETTRAIEEKQAVRRGAWAGLAAASGFSLVAEWVKTHWNLPRQQ